MKGYVLQLLSGVEWELRSADGDDILMPDDPVIYRGPMLGVTEFLVYLDDPSTPAWTLGVATWEEHELVAFLRRLDVPIPARKIDQLKRVVTLLSEGQHPRPMEVTG